MGFRADRFPRPYLSTHPQSQTVPNQQQNADPPPTSLYEDSEKNPSVLAWRSRLASASQQSPPQPSPLPFHKRARRAPPATLLNRSSPCQHSSGSGRVYR